MRNNAKPRVILNSIAGIVVFSFVTVGFADSIPGIPKVSQQKSQWCWAGASESITKYYQKNCTKTQTQIASVVTSSNTAPPPEDVKKCLEVNGEPVGLKVEHLKTTIPFARMKEVADAQHPFLFMIRWNSGGYHCNVYSGYIKDSLKLKFMDPGGGSFTYRTYAGCLNVENRGKWEQTFLTTPGVPIVNQLSPQQQGPLFSIIPASANHAAGAVNFLFNTPSSAERVLKIFNATGACIDELSIPASIMQASWPTARSIPAGMYYVMYGTKDSDIQTNATFSVLK